MEFYLRFRGFHDILANPTQSIIYNKIFIGQ